MENKTSNIKNSNWKIYFWLLSFIKPHITYFSLLLLCILGITGIEVLVPIFIQKLVDEIIPSNNIHLLQNIIIALVIGAIILISLYAVKNLLERYLRELASRDLLVNVFKHTRKLGVSYFEKTKLGELLSLLTVELSGVQEIYRLYIPHMITKILFIIVSLTILSSYSLLLTSLIVPFMLLYYIVGPKVEKIATTLSKEMVHQRSRLNSDIYYAISSMGEVRSYGANRWSYNNFLEKMNAFSKTFKKAMFFAYLRGSIRRVTINLSVVAVILLGYYLTQVNNLTVGQFVVFLFIFTRLMEEITVLITFSTEQKIVMAQAAPIYQIIKTEPTVENGNSILEKDGIIGGIRFYQVSFKYPDRNKVILNNMNYTFEKGKKIGIVGESGNGKTTILKLISRFYDPTEGVITINDVPLTKIPFDTLRNNIFYLFQESYLFATTIKENIRFGNPDATDQEVIEAAKSAYIHDYIISLPDQYETLIGEKGINLSGGQKQRISLSRMFLKNPLIILLDEATSALDNESEIKIKSALDEFLKDKTVISVAHRLKTLENFDEILVLDQGIIVEEGTYHNLLKEKGHFYKLHQSQYSKED